MIMGHCVMVIFALFLLGVIEHDVAGRVIFVKQDQIIQDPPPPDNLAKLARYIVHNSDWVSVGTISIQSGINGYPFVGLKSMVDGPVENGTGVPYMYMTDLDVSMKDLNAANKCTIFVSLAQGDYCNKKQLDPQDPRCGRVMLTGTVKKLKVGSEEEIFGKQALFARHPVMKNWPTDHGFYVVKFEISQIAMIANFGGVRYVSVNDYFNANNNFYNTNEIYNDIGDIKVIEVYY